MDIRIPKPVMLGLACSSFALLGSAFSGCVPTGPAGPTTTLNFVTGTSNSAHIQRWAPTTGTLTTIATSGLGIRLESSQPNGTALMYLTGIGIGYGGIARYYSIDPDGAAKSPRLISTGNNLTNSTTETDVPDWSPDGKYLVVSEDETLYITSPGQARTEIGPASYQTNERRWSADGKKIAYYAHFANVPGTTNIYDVVSKQIRSFDTIEIGNIHSWNADNQHFLTSTYNGTSREIIYRLVDATASEPTTYQEIWRRYFPNGGQIIPSPTQDRFLVTPRTNAELATTALAFADGRSDVVFTNVVQSEWSSEGDYLAIQRRTDAGLTEIVIADSNGQILDSSVLSTTEQSLVTTLWSKRDGLLVRYSDTSELQHLLVKNLPAGNWKEIDVGTENAALGTWSPDGNFVLISTSSQNGGGIHHYVYDNRHTGTAATPLDGEYTGYSAWSPDSAYVAVCRADPIGCAPTVINIAAGGYALTDVPASTTQPLFWTVPK